MPKADRLIRLSWWLSAAAIVCFYLIAFFFWPIIDEITPFAALPLRISALGFVLISAIFSIVVALRRWRVHRSASLMPLAFLVICFIASGFIGFTDLWLAVNFRTRLSDREQVVKRVANGEFRPNVAHNVSLISLPPQFKATSLGGGEIVIQREGVNFKVLFYTFRGVLDNFAGFVYSSDGSVPKNGDFAGEFFINRKIQDQWYYVSAH